MWNLCPYYCKHSVCCNWCSFEWQRCHFPLCGSKYGMKSREILPPKRQGRQRELISLAVLEGFMWTWSEQEIITVIFKGTWGLIIVFRRVGGLKVTFWGQYFFCRRSQRVVALVSQSDTNPNNKSDHETSRLVYSWKHTGHSGPVMAGRLCFT